MVAGVVLLFVALSFTGAVTANEMRHDGQGQTARLHTPVGVRLAQPIEDLKEPVAKCKAAAECGDANPARRKTGSTIQRILDKRRHTTGRYFYVGELADL